VIECHMASLSIVKYPQAILKKKAKAVGEITSEIEQLIPEMIETMYENEGIGLAAPQIGISERIIIVEGSREPRNQQGKPLVFLNPVIAKKIGPLIEGEEGCLSLPGIFVMVKRVEKVDVICMTREGEKVKIRAEGLAARIFQHEVDHLNGKLIINRIGPVKRLKIKTLLKELEKKANEGNR